jgi:N-acetylglucosamine transport system permease protein
MEMHKQPHNFWSIITNGLLGLWALIVVFPMIWVVYSALKTDQEIFFSPWSLPASPQWNNFVRAWTDAHIGRFFLNTMIVIIPAIFFTVMLSAMVSYVLARFPFPGNKLVLYFFMSGMLFPVFLALVPLFFLLNTLQMFGTFHGLIMVYIAFSLPFTVFFLTGFFKTIPSELHEAAIIDGANQYEVFFKVMLPLAKAGLLSMGIFNFLGQWNQYILPLVLLTDSKKYVISQGLAFLALEQKYQNDWSGLFAAIVIVMIPTLLVYILFQSQIQKGLTAGALKG